MGYTVHEMWECEWNGQIKSSPDLQVFLLSLDIIPPLNPRDAFFGGRTGAAPCIVRLMTHKGKKYVMSI